MRKHHLILCANTIFSMVIVTASNASGIRHPPDKSPLSRQSMFNSVFLINHFSEKPSPLLMQFLTWCLMESIENKQDPMSPSEFAHCVDLLCEGNALYGYQGWNATLLKNDRKVCFQKLKDTLAGQRYIRFPRATMLKNGSIKLTFLDPSVYGLTSPSLILKGSHPDYKYHKYLFDCEKPSCTRVVEFSRTFQPDWEWDKDWRFESSKTK